MADGRRRNSDGSTSVLKNGRWVKSSESTTSSKKKDKKGTSDIQRRIKEFDTLTDAGKAQADKLLGKDWALPKLDENISPDQQRILDAAASDYAKSGVNTADQVSAIKNLQDLAATAGSRSSETSSLLDALRTRAGQAGTLSGDTQLALEKMRAGLGGLTAEENTAFNEQLMGDTNRAFQGLNRNVSAMGAASGMVNPSTVRQLASDYMRARISGDQQTMLNNASVKDARLKTFGDYANTIANDMATREGNAYSLYGNALSGTETNEFNQRLSSGQALNSAVETNTNNLKTDQLARLQTWGQSVNSARQDQFNRATTNLNTLASEISTKLGIQLGVPQYILGDRASSEANRISEKAVDKASSGSGSSGSGTSPIASNDQWGGSVGFASNGSTSAVNNEMRM